MVFDITKLVAQLGTVKKPVQHNSPVPRLDFTATDDPSRVLADTDFQREYGKQIGAIPIGDNTAIVPEAMRSGIAEGMAGIKIPQVTPLTPDVPLASPNDNNIANRIADYQDFRTNPDIVGNGMGSGRVTPPNWKVPEIGEPTNPTAMPGPGDFVTGAKPDIQAAIAPVLEDAKAAGVPESELAKATAALQAAINAPPEHVHGALNGLYYALQGIIKFTNPNDQTPVTGLPKARHDYKVGEAANKVRPLQQVEEFRQKQAYDKARTQNIYADNARATNKDIATSEAKTRGDLIKQINGMPELDITDPDNAEIVAAMRKYGIPVVSKTAKTSFKYLTDAKSGKTFVDVSDAAGNRHLQELVNDDGTPFAVTTPQMMTAADRKEQRELQERLAKQGNITKIKVAEIGANSRRDIAGINQGHADYRSLVTSGSQASKVLVALDNMAPNKGESAEAFAARKTAARQKFLDSLPGDVRATIKQ